VTKEKTPERWMSVVCVCVFENEGEINECVFVLLAAMSNVCNATLTKSSPGVETEEDLCRLLTTFQVRQTCL